MRNGTRVAIAPACYSAATKIKLAKSGPYIRVEPGATGIVRDCATDEYGITSLLVRLDEGGWTRVNAALAKPTH